MDQKTKLDITDIYDDGVLRISALVGTTSRLVVSFSGIGADPKARPKEQFIASASQNGLNHVLFVMDSSRSWFNRVGITEKVVEVIAVYQREFQTEETKAVGDSMGGFCAMILPSMTAVSAVFATAPQFSIDPEVVPNETRWRAERAALGPVRYSKVDEYLQSGTLYVVVHGDAERERMQRELFPKAHNIWHFVCADSGHSIASRMRRDNVLGPVLDATFARKAKKIARLLSGNEWSKRSGGNFDVTAAAPALILRAGE